MRKRRIRIGSPRKQPERIGPSDLTPAAGAIVTPASRARPTDAEQTACPGATAVNAGVAMRRGRPVAEDTATSPAPRRPASVVMWRRGSDADMMQQHCWTAMGWAVAASPS